MHTTNTLVLQYMPLANKQAWNKYRKTSNSFFEHISFEELQSAAYFGLVQAANNYKSSENCDFAYYARFRIDGAMGDYLRESVFFKNANEIEEDLDQIEVEDDANFDDFFDDLTYDLDDTGRKIIRMYYCDNFSMKEIGEEIGCKISWVSQLLKTNKEKLARYERQAA